MTSDFTKQLPVDECYIMSFIAHNGECMMDEFWDNIVLDCGPDQIGEFDYQICLSPGDSPLDLGAVTVHSDHSFAMPMNNPPRAVDNNGDGIPDFNDPGVVQDNYHDGYYDDDMNHDSFHDDDMNHDGFHNDDMNHDRFPDGAPMGGGGGGMGM